MKKALLLAAFLFGLPLAATTNPVLLVSVACPSVVGNGSTDDTTAMQACLDAVPNYSTLQFDAGSLYKITSTLNFHARHSAVLQGLSGPPGSPYSGQSPSFIWAGADGGTVISLVDSNANVLENFNIYSWTSNSTGTHGAAILIDYDQSGMGPFISTANQFLGLGLFGYQDRTDFYAIRVGFTSGNNLEHNIVGGGTNIYCSHSGGNGIGYDDHFSANSLNNVVQNSSFNECAVGAYGQGTTVFKDNSFETNTVAMQGGSLIQHNDMENDTQCVLILGSSQVTIDSNRCANPTPAVGHSAIETTGGGIAEITNNQFTIYSSSYSSIGCLVAGNSGTLTLINNTLNMGQVATQAALLNCVGAGNFYGPNSGVTTGPLSFPFVGTIDPTPISGLTQFLYAESTDGTAAQLRLTEGTNAARAVLPHHVIVEGGLPIPFGLFQDGYTVVDNANSPNTYTLPSSGTQPSNGAFIQLIIYGSGAVTIAPNGQNINGSSSSIVIPGGSASRPTGAFIVSDGTNYDAQVYLQ